MSAKNSQPVSQLKQNNSNSFIKNIFNEDNNEAKSHRNLRYSKINLKEKSLDKQNISGGSTLASVHKNDRLLTKSDKPIAINSQLVVSNNRENVFKQYKILKKIGEGSYGVVWKVKHKKTNLIRAMKKIKKNIKNRNDTTKDIINEIELLRKLDHPNIVKIFEFFNEPDGYYLITEFCSGGELFDEIKKKKYFPENIAANIMYQIFNAINYCHTFGKIIHRDIKPENILIVNHDEMTGFYTIKIIDFGTAKIYEKNKNENKIIGSSYYIAPEVLQKNYNEKCDIWSVGVILYILLCGYPPFNGKNNRELYNEIQFREPDFSGEEWETVSEDAKKLIKMCLIKDMNKRPTSKEILKNKWLRINGKTLSNSLSQSFVKSFNKSVVKKMAFFVKENKLKQAVLKFITTQFDLEKEEEELRKIFKQFDINNDGIITKKEFKSQLIKIYGENNSEEITRKIFPKIDVDNSGEISYNEFLTCLIDTKKVLTVDKLDKAFKLFDKDNSGKLSIKEIKNVFGGTDKQWEKIFSEVDQNNDGEVDFEEFKILMMGWNNTVFKEENKELKESN